MSAPLRYDEVSLQRVLTTWAMNSSAWLPLRRVTL